jgi:arylsulfatase A-like enzyme
MNDQIETVAMDGNRRTFLKSIAGVVGTTVMGPLARGQTAAASPAAQPAAAPAGSGARTNVLILHSHDSGRFFHCYGVKTAHTPHLDRFASEGVLFEQCFATAPQCSPSRASIFTGRYPHNNGVMGLTHHPFNWELNPDELHLGQILKSAGYRTAGVGVVHESHIGPARCGLDEYSKPQEATKVADATIEMLTRFAKDPSKPFYIQAGTIETHRQEGTDRTADMGFLGTYLKPDVPEGVTVPGYLRDTPGTEAELGELQGSVKHLDEELGRIFDALKTLNLEQNTLVIYTTDHGIALPRAKCSVYEPGQQTAFILRLPSRPGWSGGDRKTAMISNIDYLPTILDAVGVPIPDRVQGRSFAPLLDGKAYQDRDILFYELSYHDYYDPQRAVRTADHKLIVYYTNAPAFMDPSQSWRPRCDTVVPPNHAHSQHETVELYDLKKDPLEQENVAKHPEYKEILEDLRGKLYAHMQETSDPLLNGAITSPMHDSGVGFLKSGAKV